MNAPTQLAVKYFKRNREAKAAHIVLNNVFAKLDRAEMYRKAISARCVTSILRTEVLLHLGEAQVTDVEANETLNPKLTDNDNRNSGSTRTGRRSTTQSK